MDAFILSIAPQQQPFIKLPNSISLTNSIKWTNLYHLDESEFSQLTLVDCVYQSSLYNSILYLLSPKYQLSVSPTQKDVIINDFIRFTITQLETKHTIKLPINSLISELKDKSRQSNIIIYCIAMILDLNIIVLSASDNNNVELYYHEKEYDNCKLHIVMYRDPQSRYSPVLVQKKPMVNCFENQVISHLINNNDVLEFNDSNYTRIK